MGWWYSELAGPDHGALTFNVETAIIWAQLKSQFLEGVALVAQRLRPKSRSRRLPCFVQCVISCARFVIQLGIAGRFKRRHLHWSSAAL